MVLTINGGSSSLKFALFEAGDPPKRLVTGRFERIGTPDAQFRLGDSAPVPAVAPDHGACVPLLMDAIGDASVDAVAHRIVHGGPHYFDPQPVTRAMLDELRRFKDFVPEHLPAEIQLIEVLENRFNGAPHIACFDTGFHRDMPRVAQLLPIPRTYADRGIRRYGFHGLSYSWLMQRLARVGGESEASGRIVLAHLGNGCSMAAVRAGKCIETTMGFTPAAGLVMSRRSGDIDPGLVAYLSRVEGVTPEEFNRMINTRSGLLGISETTSDVRDLLERESTDPRAAEALDVFCYQARKWIGALAAVCGGLDTLVFSGGIGENAPAIRQRICTGLEFLGIGIDTEANRIGGELIGSRDSRVKVRVLRTDEELYMAQCAFRVISSRA